MRAYDIIYKKKNGMELTDEEIRFVVKGVTDGSIPDYQTAALLMAICFQGMTERETQTLTLEMAHSGDVMDLSFIPGKKADKHSTGGVGDKTTLAVVPIVAACGVKVPKMSGRGLGHTGGTIDKLESIPGFNTALSHEQFVKNMDEVGACILGQSLELAPADKKLYALRDVTATVDSIPLIASSIMSKKLASGADIILLDVKYGRGAFMQTKEKALELAEEMVRIGTRAGRQTAALITDMNVPLGYAVGNALEVQESIKVLKGEGAKDLENVCIALSAAILEMAGKGTYAECTALARHTLESGAALDKLRSIVAAQGGDVRYVDDTGMFAKAKCRKDVIAEHGGYIAVMDARVIGDSSVKLGAGRLSKEDRLDYSAGIILKKSFGDRVESGETIAELYAPDEEKLREGENVFKNAFELSQNKPESISRIYARVNADGVSYFKK